VRPLLTRREWLLALLLVVPLTSCGDEGSSLDAAAGPDLVPVAITDFRFEPKHLTVRRGQTLAVRNDGEIAHNLTIEEGASPRERSDPVAGTGSFLPGRRVLLRVAVPAGRTYSLACTVPGHRDLGLFGTLRVRDGAGRGPS
jgi:uncharacterized cupredoxin-like copper-binding protein